MQNRVLLGLLVALAVAAVAYLSNQPAGEKISGRASVTDGDSLNIGSTRIRLHAVDAPEGRQPCQRNGAPWRCGEAAAAKLRELVGTGQIVCTKTDTDNYGRTVAICSNGSADLGRELVLAGLALAYRQFGDDYVDEEAQARAARRGVWAGTFTPPWDWRRDPQAESRPSVREPAEPGGNGDCLIKGNISRNNDQRIYHVPGSPSYAQTVIDASRGERWFCTEDEARAAGWRAPRG
jgi:endonuclease YncB( thermonuclease family)